MPSTSAPSRLVFSRNRVQQFPSIHSRKLQVKHRDIERLLLD
jgi:hypothetical protein